MKQKNLPKWKERTLLEKLFTCLVLLFGILAITFIILETAEVNVPNRLDSIFLFLELMCIGALNYKYNRSFSIFLLAMCGISIIITIINML